MASPCSALASHAHARSATNVTVNVTVNVTINVTSSHLTHTREVQQNKN